MRILCGFLVILVPGCISYEPRPLDHEGLEAEFLARTPESPDLLPLAALHRGVIDRAPVEFRPSDGLTENEGEILVLFFNPELRAERARALVAHAGQEFAGTWKDPVFGLAAERIVERVEEPWIVGGTTTWSIPISGRPAAERAAAEREAELARTEVRLLEWKLRFDLHREWARWSSERVIVEELEAHLQRLESLSRTVEQLQASGEIPKFEGRLFVLERTTSILDLQEAKSKEESRRRSLRRLMGLSNSAPLELLPALSPPSLGGSPGDRLQRAGRESPRLARARSAYELAEAELLLATRGQIPDLELSPGLSVEDGMVRTLLGLAFPWPVLTGARRQIALARARRDQGRADYALVLSSLHADLADAEAAHSFALRQHEEIALRLLPLVEDQFQDAKSAAALGSFDPLILLDSLTRLRHARERWVETRLSVVTSAKDVSELVGDPGFISDGLAIEGAEEGR